jgi:hypothetical protein
VHGTRKLFIKAEFLATLFDYTNSIPNNRTSVILAKENDTLFEEKSIVGYWADINPVDYHDGLADPNRLDLNGFYFDEDGSGLLFHNLEGAFIITSYSISEGILTICFQNRADEPAEWNFPVIKVNDNDMILGADIIDFGRTISYSRMREIQPYNCTGGYTVTKIDGSIVDVWGPP